MSDGDSLRKTFDLRSRDEYIQLMKKLDQMEENLENLSQKFLNNGREKLDKWRDQSIQIINQFYQEKSFELEENCLLKISKPKIDINQIRSQIFDIIEEDSSDIQLLTSNIQHLKQNIEDLEDKDIQIHIESLKITKDLISFENILSDNFNLSLLYSPCHTIQSSDRNSWSITTNDQYILIDQYPYLYLLDQNLTIINQYQWKLNSILDICWLNQLKKYLICTSNQIYLLDQNFHSIEQIHSIKGNQWWSCTSSDAFLYLTKNQRGTGIFQYNILSSFQLIKQWKSTELNEEDQLIYDLTYQNDKLGCIVSYSSNRTANLIIRSSITFHLLWLYQLDLNYKWFQTSIRCSSLTNNQWLILEEYTSHLFHIDQNGQIISKCQYNSQPSNACLFRTDILAIRTDTAIHFHRV